jgi:hypothetical protein
VQIINYTQLANDWVKIKSGRLSMIDSLPDFILRDLLRGYTFNPALYPFTAK